MDFSGFLGNEQVKDSLSAAFREGEFPHAILLQGEKGTGKRSLAKLLARALVCRQNDHASAPCGVCSSCIRAKAGSHPDIRVEEGSGATRSLSVDTVKAIIADAHKKPEEADVQVYLLFIENTISEAAQNKLLKIMEEPPPRTVFILTCRSEQLLLPTVRSRVQSFMLRPPVLDEAADWIARKLDLPSEEARRLAELCKGNLGRMLEEAENGQAASVRAAVDRILPQITSRSEQEIFAATAGLIRDRKQFAAVLTELQEVLRQAILAKSGYTEGGQAQRERIAPLMSLSLERLMTLMELTREYAAKLERNANMSLLVTSLCAQMRRVAGRYSPCKRQTGV